MKSPRRCWTLVGFRAGSEAEADFESDGGRSWPRLALHVSMTFLKNFSAYSVVQMGLPQDLARWAGDCWRRSDCCWFERKPELMPGAGLQGLGGALDGLLLLYCCCCCCCRTRWSIASARLRGIDGLVVVDPLASASPGCVGFGVPPIHGDEGEASFTYCCRCGWYTYDSGVLGVCGVVGVAGRCCCCCC